MTKEIIFNEIEAYEGERPARYVIGYHKDLHPHISAAQQALLSSNIDVDKLNGIEFVLIDSGEPVDSIITVNDRVNFGKAFESSRDQITGLPIFKFNTRKALKNSFVITRSNILHFINETKKTREDQILDKQFFIDYRKLPFDRHAPNEKGEMRRIPAGSLKFLITPSEPELAAINSIIKETKNTSEPLTIMIPTCPADNCKVDSNWKVLLTMSPCGTDVGWVQYTAIQAAATLAKKLTAENVPFRLVFGFGDYEHIQGNTRGMTEEHYYRNLSQSMDSCLITLQEYLSVDGTSDKERYSENVIPGVVVPTTVFDIQNQSLKDITTTGILSMADGKESWLGQKEIAKEKIREIAESGEHSAKIQKIFSSRRGLYATFLIKAGNPNPTEENLWNFLLDDLACYVAFHSLVKQSFGENVIVLSADSYPMEKAAAAIVGNKHLSAAGNYLGSH